VAAEERESLEGWPRRPVHGEKAQIQVLGRSQPLLPKRPGQPECRTLGLSTIGLPVHAPYCNLFNVLKTQSREGFMKASLESIDA
jgi:hypothetical protein